MLLDTGHSVHRPWPQDLPLCRIIARQKSRRIDAAIEDLTEDEALSEQEKLKQKWATVEALVGAEKRLRMVAADMVQHFEDRVAAMDGKAMVVCMSRRICVELYKEIVALRPDWHSDDNKMGLIKVVMTGNASDPQDWQPHIGNKMRRENLAKRAKDPNDSLKLVIVRDMWLTGFDAPSMHTMYLDKPMRGHGLMQAIARVNRVFKDKPAGLVVDYIGIGQNLKNALGQYSASDQKQAGIDEAEAIAVMLEKYDVVKSMFHGFDYSRAFHGTPQERLGVMAEAIEWILDYQHKLAEKEQKEDDKKRAHRRFQDAVLTLSKAFALCSASDEAREIRDDVGFFQTIRAALVKSTIGSGKSSAERPFGKLSIRLLPIPKSLTLRQRLALKPLIFLFFLMRFLPKKSRWKKRIWRWKRSKNCSMMRLNHAVIPMLLKHNVFQNAYRKLLHVIIQMKSALLKYFRN